MTSLSEAELPDANPIELSPRELTALDAQPRKQRNRQSALFTDEDAI